MWPRQSSSTATTAGLGITILRRFTNLAMNLTPLIMASILARRNTGETGLKVEVLACSLAGLPSTQTGGPGNDVEIRENYVGKDLNWQFLSANAGSSPAAPFGCGTLSGSYTGGNGCPFQYAIKNDFELKLGHRILVNGNVIDGSWSDGQSGFCVLINVRTASGGETAGNFRSIHRTAKDLHRQHPVCKQLGTELSTADSDE